MSDELVPESVEHFPAHLVEVAREYTRHVRAKATLRAYAFDWRLFSGWCARHGLEPLPAKPETIAAFLLDHAEGTADGRKRKPSTLARYLATVSARHRRAGYPSPWDDPRVQDVMDAIKRKNGEAPTKKTPLLPADLAVLVRELPPGLRGMRDRVLLLLGFAGAFRRSELVGLDVEDLAFGKDGLRVTIRQSKTDQTAKGVVIGIPFAKDERLCPIGAVKAWLEASKIAEGAVFRGVRKGRVLEGRLSDCMVARVAKAAAKRAGLDPATFAGHSLRAGLATAAAREGKPLHRIMAQTRQRSAETALGYVRDAELLGPDNAADGLL